MHVDLVGEHVIARLQNINRSRDEESRGRDGLRVGGDRRSSHVL